MKILTAILLILSLISCNNQTQVPIKASQTANDQVELQDSIFNTQIIKNITDTSIHNSSNRSIDILFNGTDNYLGGKRNPNLNFATECMICQPVQIFKQGFLFGKRLYITKDSVFIYSSDQDISDTTGMIKMIGHYGERNTKTFPFSKGRLTMKFQGQSCNDADFISVKLSYDKGSIKFDKLINATFFEYDLDRNGISEQYILGTRNCSQEVVLLRVNDASK